MKKITLFMIGLLGLLSLVAGCTQNYLDGSYASAASDTAKGSDSGRQDSQITPLGLDRYGYVPREITVEANKPVILRNDGTLRGCGLYVTQPELGINANFAKNNDYTFTPTQKGKFTFTCSMGMY